MFLAIRSNTEIMGVQENWLANLKAIVDAEAPGDKKRPGYRAVAAATGLKEEYVYQLYTGRKPVLGVDAAKTIARAFSHGADPSWFDLPPDPKRAPYLTGGSVDELPNAAGKFNRNIDHANTEVTYAGIPQYEGMTPVVSNIRVVEDGSYTEDRIEEGQGGWVETKGGEDSYAMRVKTDALSPAYKAGWFLLVRPTAPVKGGKNVILGKKDGARLIREFMYEQPGSVVVMSVKGGLPQTIERDDIEFMHLIYGSLDADEWHAPETTSDTGIPMDSRDHPPAYGDLHDGVLTEKDRSEAAPARKKGAKL